MNRAGAPTTSARVRGAIAHAMAGAVVVATSVIVTAVAYVVLFLVAIVFDLPLGSPVAGPALCLFAALFGLCVALLVLLPATFIARVLCGRVQALSRYRPWSEIPVASCLTALLGLLGARAFDEPVVDGVLFGLFLLLPLGLYWWTLTLSRFGLGGVARVGRALQRRVTLRD